MGKIKLIENVLVPASMTTKLDIPLSEAVVEGTPYKALAVYRFPFTRPGQKNLNCLSSLLPGLSCTPG